MVAHYQSTIPDTGGCSEIGPCNYPREPETIAFYKTTLDAESPMTLTLPAMEGGRLKRAEIDVPGKYITTFSGFNTSEASFAASSKVTDGPIRRWSGSLTVPASCDGDEQVELLMTHMSNVDLSDVEFTVSFEENPDCEPEGAGRVEDINAAFYGRWRASEPTKRNIFSKSADNSNIRDGNRMRTEGISGDIFLVLSPGGKGSYIYRKYVFQQTIIKNGRKLPPLELNGTVSFDWSVTEDEFRSTITGTDLRGTTSGITIRVPNLGFPGSGSAEYDFIVGPLPLGTPRSLIIKSDSVSTVSTLWLFDAPIGE